MSTFRKKREFRKLVKISTKKRHALFFANGKGGWRHRDLEDGPRGDVAAGGGGRSDGGGHPQGRDGGARGPGLRSARRRRRGGRQR